MCTHRLQRACHEYYCSNQHMPYHMQRDQVPNTNSQSGQETLNLLCIVSTILQLLIEL